MYSPWTEEENRKRGEIRVRWGGRDARIERGEEDRVGAGRREQERPAEAQRRWAELGVCAAPGARSMHPHSSIAPQCLHILWEMICEPRKLHAPGCLGILGERVRKSQGVRGI